jgi:hypothetical protein
MIGGNCTGNEGRRPAIALWHAARWKDWMAGVGQGMR